MKVDAEAAGFSQSRLERITHHFDKGYVSTGKIAGCQITVTRGGNVAYFRSLGRMDRERNKVVTEDTVWRIYSMTKPITSIALDAALREGRLPAERPGRALHPVVEGPEGRRREEGRVDQAASGRPPDLDPRRPHAHDRAPRLRRPQPDRPGLCLGPRGGRGRPHARGRLRAAGRPAPQVPARHRLELRPVDRRLRPSGGDHLGPPVRRLPRGRDLRTARHGRHRLRGARRRRGALQRLLPLLAGPGPRAHGRPGHQRLPALAGLPVRSGRPRVDLRRLPLASARCSSARASSTGTGSSVARRSSS